MKRKEFFKKLGIVSTISIITPKVLASKTAIKPIRKFELFEIANVEPDPNAFKRQLGDSEGLIHISPKTGTWIPIPKNVKIPDNMKFTPKELKPLLGIMGREKAERIWKEIINKNLKNHERKTPIQ
jgi:hypothetical protein